MNNELHTRAIQASARFCERRGYEILEEAWSPDGSRQVDLIARDKDVIVFINVTASMRADGGFADGHIARSDMELLAADWLAENAPEGDITIRFDTIDMIVVAVSRALLRHHINAYSAVA